MRRSYTDKFKEGPKTEETPKDNANDKATDKPRASVDSRFFRNKQDLLGLVDQTQEGTVEEQLELVRDPYLRGYAAADGPELSITSCREDVDFPSFREVTPANEWEKQILRELGMAIAGRIRNPYKVSIDSVYRLYRSLPEPRMSYLHAQLRHGLLRALGREKKELKSMLRYFAVIADIRASGLRLTRPEWNSAMSFAARYVGHSTEVEAVAALNLWKEMEKEAGLQANSVTFNILFDVASKAGNYLLADMLYEEMGKRGLPYNRYHHVSLIHFFGLKLDSDGVRAAYKEMVEAGEMIDSVVLNCVIAGLLRCGEEDAAERVYERMKTAHAQVPEMPHRNYVNDTVITKVLMMFAKVGNEHKEDPALRERFQRASPIVPNLQTYRILLNHYSIKMAALDKVAKYLDDMKWFQIPLHGAIFLALFKGFAHHGGSMGQDWSLSRLNEVYKAFLSAFDEGAAGLYIDVWLVKWLMRAYRRCSDNDMVWQVYEDLSARWELDQEELDHLKEFLADMFRNDKLKTYRDKNAFYRGKKNQGGGQM